MTDAMQQDTKVLTHADKRRPPNAGKGRVKGTPNKVTRELKEMILEALDGAGGVEYLIQRAQDTPGPFLALVGKVLPMTVQGTGEGGAHVVEIVRFGVGK